MVGPATRVAAQSANFEVDCSHPGCERLKPAIAVRNRLTHPKSIGDLTVEVTEVAKAHTGFFWLLALVIEGMSAMNHNLAVHNADARDLLDRLKRSDPDAIDDYQRVFSSTP